MPLDYAAIGGRLQARRKELGITQEDAAERSASLWSTCPKLKTDGCIRRWTCWTGSAVFWNTTLPEPSPGVQTTSPDYGQEQVLRLFNACAPRVKPVVLASAGAAGNLNVSRSGKSMHHVCPAKKRRPGGIFQPGAALVFSKSVPDTSIPCGWRQGTSLRTLAEAGVEAVMFPRTAQ